MESDSNYDGADTAHDSHPSYDHVTNTEPSRHGENESAQSGGEANHTQYYHKNEVTLPIHQDDVDYQNGHVIEPKESHYLTTANLDIKERLVTDNPPDKMDQAYTNPGFEDTEIPLRNGKRENGNDKNAPEYIAVRSSFNNTKPMNGDMTCDYASTDHPTNEMVNLELINLKPLNNGVDAPYEVNSISEIPVKKGNDDERRISYDEYFVPVNEHRKYMRGEKLYVTADKRSKKSRSKYLCWIICICIVAAALIIGILAAVGVIGNKTPIVLKEMTARQFNGDEPPVKGASIFHDIESKPNSPPIRAGPPKVPRALESELTIDNKEFSPELTDKTSFEYQQLAETIEDELKSYVMSDEILQTQIENVAVKIMSFLPGSIVTKFRLSWDYKDVPYTNQNDVDEEIMKRISELRRNNGDFISQYHMKPKMIPAERITDLCQIDNNGCEATCGFDHAQRLDFVCTCPDGQILSPNGKSCVEKMVPAMEFTEVPVYHHLEHNEYGTEAPHWHSAEPEPTAEPNIIHVQTSTPTNVHYVYEEHENEAEPAEPSSEPAAEPTAEPAAEPSPEPAAEPLPEPTAQPSPKPAAEPLPEPTAEPAAEPAVEPSPEPAVVPFLKPVTEPTTEPTAEHSAEPITEPSVESREQPAVEPTAEPSPESEVEPAVEPTAEPAAEPSSKLEVEPAVAATAEPATEPSPKPDVEPAVEPTAEPAAEPSPKSDVEPAVEPTAEPVAEPSPEPEVEPAVEPTAEPVAEPSSELEIQPATIESFSKPSAVSSTETGTEPSAEPTSEPNAELTAERNSSTNVDEPAVKPLAELAVEPTAEPISEPVTTPLVLPSMSSSAEPSVETVPTPEPALPSTELSVEPNVISGMTTIPPHLENTQDHMAVIHQSEKSTEEIAPTPEPSTEENKIPAVTINGHHNNDIFVETEHDQSTESPESNTVKVSSSSDSEHSEQEITTKTTIYAIPAMQSHETTLKPVEEMPAEHDPHMTHFENEEATYLEPHSVSSVNPITESPSTENSAIDNNNEIKISDELNVIGIKESNEQSSSSRETMIPVIISYGPSTPITTTTTKKSEEETPTRIPMINDNMPHGILRLVTPEAEIVTQSASFEGTTLPSLSVMNMHQEIKAETTLTSHQPIIISPVLAQSHVNKTHEATSSEISHIIGDHTERNQIQHQTDHVAPENMSPFLPEIENDTLVSILHNGDHDTERNESDEIENPEFNDIIESDHKTSNVQGRHFKDHSIFLNLNHQVTDVVAHTTTSVLNTSQAVPISTMAPTSEIGSTEIPTFMGNSTENDNTKHSEEIPNKYSDISTTAKSLFSQDIVTMLYNAIMNETTSPEPVTASPVDNAIPQEQDTTGASEITKEMTTVTSINFISNISTDPVESTTVIHENVFVGKNWDESTTSIKDADIEREQVSTITNEESNNIVETETKNVTPNNEPLEDLLAIDSTTLFDNVTTTINTTNELVENLQQNDTDTQVGITTMPPDPVTALVMSSSTTLTMSKEHDETSTSMIMNEKMFKEYEPTKSFVQDSPGSEKSKMNAETSDDVTTASPNLNDIDVQITTMKTELNMSHEHVVLQSTEPEMDITSKVDVSTDTPFKIEDITVRENLTGSSTPTETSHIQITTVVPLETEQKTLMVTTTPSTNDNDTSKPKESVPILEPDQNDDLSIAPLDSSNSITNNNVEENKTPTTNPPNQAVPALER